MRQWGAGLDTCHSCIQGWPFCCRWRGVTHVLHLSRMCCYRVPAVPRLGDGWQLCLPHASLAADVPPLKIQFFFPSAVVFLRFFPRSLTLILLAGFFYLLMFNFFFCSTQQDLLVSLGVSLVVWTFLSSCQPRGYSLFPPSSPRLARRTRFLFFFFFTSNLYSVFDPVPSLVSP